MKSQIQLCVIVALFVGGCGGQDLDPPAFVQLQVVSDGTVTAYLTDFEGVVVYEEGTYLQIRGERTGFIYAGSSESPQRICEQLPVSGSLELRLTTPFEYCPEIHVAAYRHEPPITITADGTKVQAAEVPLAERCSTHQTLIDVAYWLPSGCENVRADPLGRL